MKMHEGFTVVIAGLAILLFPSISRAGDALMGNNASEATHVVVDQSGNGDFRRIQDAIDAIPSSNSQQVFISIKPGTYREKIVVPENKPFITLSGTKSSNTIITWSDGSGDIFNSPTVSILASGFVGRDLTIQNTFGVGERAVALRVAGDQVAFYRCRILSYQDTLLDDAGRHYYKNCYIEGGTDFICGDAASLFENCHVHSISQENGSITAQHRQSGTDNTGYVFLGCKITGVKSAFLGRPWGDYSRVVFALSYLSPAILPQGWDEWNDQKKHSNVYYGEYKCSGPGANRSERVDWSRSLSDGEAAPFLTKDLIGGQDWLTRKPTTPFGRGSP
ncbi:putative pectinesterase 11 [Syzygium oleosum]|uniref:putative pectinesterase 11 n=1 Tax=Syzygium oleosum TaxID=219896 RepID=UPI0024B9737B|nr:putative pectinesterase 11 [Syzygium oleosum]